MDVLSLPVQPFDVALAPTQLRECDEMQRAIPALTGQGAQERERYDGPARVIRVVTGAHDHARGVAGSADELGLDVVGAKRLVDGRPNDGLTGVEHRPSDGVFEGAPSPCVIGARRVDQTLEVCSEGGA